MKKYLLTTAFIILCVSFKSQAQGGDIVIKGSKEIPKKMTPQQVMDSLNKRFPDAKAVKYYESKADVVNKGWTVSEEDNLAPGADVGYYTISFKRADLKYYGLYDKDGNLLQSKVEETVKELPEPVRNSLNRLSQEHPGYKVVSKTFYKNQNYSKSKEYYEVIAEKDKVRKRLYYAPDGTLIKIKG
ncbi:hypothetical protein OCK74_24485 [Chitinophagaceae bacterium LB-8]|uniref:Beta-lactamase-inhibitor-like PepSY-like domain-containing protein n=1 Tax=Paraflavisolibacter caeni TaxID=2982496 RepID=A0A9X2XZU3_9BACT|nr:hypothetical protein [Paraflavisolibacter caeni]MCU7552300.1 hypothetical protein [Paraflavisolibacter caeni]